MSISRNEEYLGPIKKDPLLNKSLAQSYEMSPYKASRNPLELIDISKYKAMVKYSTQNGGPDQATLKKNSNDLSYHEKSINDSINLDYVDRDYPQNVRVIFGIFEVSLNISFA